MDNVTKTLGRLSKIEPKKSFVKAAKGRIMNQVRTGQSDGWLWAFVKKLKSSNPSRQFIVQARVRLMHQIQTTPGLAQKPLNRVGLFFHWLKRATASTLVMLLVTIFTLFFVEGGDNVTQASSDSFLEVLEGDAAVKHADGLVWEPVQQQIQLQAGDLIQLGEGDQAVIHFFDDTQVRLNENSTLLISQLAFSPSFSSQGIIETYLRQGEAWVQTLNIDDGHARFTLETPDLLTEALHASFTVESQPNQASQLSIFNGKIDLSFLDAESEAPFKAERFTANKTVLPTKNAQGEWVMEAVTTTPELKDTAWVKMNLEADKTYLAELQEKSYERLTLLAGTLPGEMLYPVKQAKERLRLVFGEDESISIKIEMANSRLNEAIVLFERGESEKANAALDAYQKIAVEIRNERGKDEDSNEAIVTQLVGSQQKMLSTQPVDKNAITIKERLQETVEEFAQNPLDLEKKRLDHSVADLHDVLSMIEGGELELAKEKLVKLKNQRDDLLTALDQLSNDVQKRDIFEKVLVLKEEERDLLALASESLLTQKENDQELMVMVADASKEADVQVKATQKAAMILLPELAEKLENKTEEVENSILTDEFLEISALVERIYIYSSWDAQLNQIERFFGNDFINPERLSYLKAVLQQLHGRARDYVAVRILQLENQIELNQALEPIAEPEEALENEIETEEINQMPEWLQLDSADFLEDQVQSEVEIEIKDEVEASSMPQEKNLDQVRE